MAATVMGEIEAQQIITANAACQIVGGCDLCPFFKEDVERTRERGKHEGAWKVPRGY
jgi:hypothetical protein